MTVRQFVPLGCLMLFCLGICGCQSLRDRTASISQKTKDLMTWDDEKEPGPAEQPAKLVAIWSESIIYGPDSRPTRGLGGRIYFYNAKHQAVPVSGELIVYAYDDETGEDRQQPDRKYVITAEQMQQHQSESEFGPSYSVWIPWDSVGGEQKAVSLLPIFKSSEGQVVAGDYARNLLSGKKLQARRLPNDRRQLAERSYGAGPASTIQQVSYASPADDQDVLANATSAIESTSDSEQRVLRSSTFEVPATMRQRLLSESTAPQAGSDDDAAVQRRGSLSERIERMQPQVSDPVVREAWGPPTMPRTTHRELLKSPAPVAPSSPQAHGPPLWQRPRATWRSDPQSPAGSNPSFGSDSSSSNAVGPYSEPAFPAATRTGTQSSFEFGG